ncbi:MAG: DUF354 domain-containing protein [Bacteroidales bacterium]|nr:DUF354 domain-containing protein [Bacteroidales bacterium]
MRILLACYHPGELHVVKYVIKLLEQRSHHVKLVFTEKENIVEEIAKKYHDDFELLGFEKNSLFGKIFNIIKIESKFYRVVKTFKPDIIFSPSSPYSGIIAKLFNIPHICWADTETATFNLKTSLPFIDALLIPDCFYLKLKNEKKTIKYSGYKELAYLHPKHFHPEKSICDRLGNKRDEKIVLLRFSALHAMHDLGLVSTSISYKEKIIYYVKELEKYSKVYISTTEREMGIELEKNKLKIHPNDYLDFLSFCSLYIGEGTTTASEAGVMGVPWINIQQTKRGYLIDQEEKYSLGFRTDNIDHAFTTALEWLKQDDLLVNWKKKREKLLNNKIDVASFFVWFIENYPESHKVMNDNPDYQLIFK